VASLSRFEFNPGEMEKLRGETLAFLYSARSKLLRAAHAKPQPFQKLATSAPADLPGFGQVRTLPR
jgi:hypothetical protein